MNVLVGQGVLYIMHPQKAPQLRIKPGMEISVIQYRDSTTIRGLVGHIDSQYIDVSQFHIPLRLVDEIHYQNQFHRLFGDAVLAAGAFALVIPPINNTINNLPAWDRDYLMAAFIGIPAGIAIKKLTIKKFKKKKGYYWQYYHLE
ncbi:hypothetical protein [Thermaurantimonas aggregans]|uniref:hypothetical protein n=1 Tax=Thermaurantimonas aggregans TaxID=2173829 RepID=UPI000F580EDE|nr:hypothetical protein [Thermaurantimonas aggregans]MCX8149338.1 hypothetical protein [Thermaurantimonas aggregans]